MKNSFIRDITLYVNVIDGPYYNGIYLIQKILIQNTKNTKNVDFFFRKEWCSDSGDNSNNGI